MVSSVSFVVAIDVDVDVDVFMLMLMLMLLLLSLPLAALSQSLSTYSLDVYWFNLLVWYAVNLLIIVKFLIITKQIMQAKILIIFVVVNCIAAGVGCYKYCTCSGIPV
jgi:hypothetical protein